MISAEIALCHCGLKRGHKGWHKGQKQPHQPGGEAKTRTRIRTDSKLRALVDRSIMACHADIARLKGVIKSAQAELLDAEARLHPLIALAETYKQLALPAPDRTQPIIKAPVESKPAAALAESKPRKSDGTETEEDYAPQEVTFGQVTAWAAVRNLAFKSWNDLPAINQRREQFELPPFKRKMTAYEVGKQLG